MKETTERAKLLQQALDIADSLCKVAKVDDNGLYWETLSLGPNLTPTYMRDDSYYSGTTGIVAFLSQLYSQTREQKYLSVAIDAAKSTLKHAQSTPQGIEGFYVGKTGVFCSLAELSLVTGDQFFVDECLSQIKTQMLDRIHLNELLGGRAGCVLGLLRLYRVRSDKELLPIIRSLIADIIHSVQLSTQGLCWDKRKSNIKELCGLSHGAAGIGVMFAELYQVTANKFFGFMADQAFAYENQYFDVAAGNWPDFRKNYHDPRSKQVALDRLKAKDKDFFCQHAFLSAWCHGALGIGLSRLRSYQIMKRPSLLRDLNQARKNVDSITARDLDKKTLRNFTICHGLGGNAAFYLQLYRHSGKVSYLKKARAIGQAAISDFAREKRFKSGYALTDQEDYSLFMGNSGIGYGLLQLAYPLRVPPIAHLEVGITKPDSSLASALNFSVSDLERTLRSRYEIPSAYKKRLVTGSQFSGSALLSTMKNHQKNTKQVSGTLEIALAHISLESSDRNYFLESVEHLQNNQTFKEILANRRRFLNEPFSLCRGCQLVKVQKEGVKRYFLLFRNDLEIIRTEVSALAYKILTRCKKATTTLDTCKYIQSIYYPMVLQNKRRISELVEEQIRHALEVNILIFERNTIVT